MHLPLTERITCPRCGPGFPLVLLARRVEDRRVLDGDLGCPNCRDRFPVDGGFADLRAPPRRPLEPPGEAEATDALRWVAARLGVAAGVAPEAAAGADAAPDAADAADAVAPVAADSADASAAATDAALRLAALLNVAEGPGTVALLGRVAALADPLAARIEDLEVAVVWAGARVLPERARVSRMVTSPGLPFRPSGFRAVALADAPPGGLLEEAARVVVPTGRVVLLGAGDDAAGRAEAAGLRVLLRQDDVVVAERAGPRAPSTGVRLPVVG